MEYLGSLCRNLMMFPTLTTNKTVLNPGLSSSDQHFSSSVARVADPYLSLDFSQIIFLNFITYLSDANSLYFLMPSGNFAFNHKFGARTMLIANDFRIYDVFGSRTTTSLTLSFCSLISYCDLCYGGVCYRCWYNYNLANNRCVFCDTLTSMVYDPMSQMCVSASQMYAVFIESQSAINYFTNSNISLFSISCTVQRLYVGAPIDTFAFHESSLSFSKFQDLLNPSKNVTFYDIYDELFRVQVWYLDYFKKAILP